MLHYNIKVDNYVIESNYYIIYSNEKRFYLYTVYDNNYVLKQIYNTFSYPFFYKPILNKKNSFISYFNNFNYILFESLSNSFNKNFLINEKLITSYSCYIDWKNTWIRKVDYICNYFLYNKSTDLYLIDSFDYYISLAEYTITLLNQFDGHVGRTSICYLSYLNNDFFNPLNTKIDLSERNFAEYLKMLFYEDNIDYDSLDFMLCKYAKSYNYSLIFIRLLFPSDYFYSLDKYFLEGDSKLLVKIVSRCELYEKYIKKVYVLMKKYQAIKKISL